MYHIAKFACFTKATRQKFLTPVRNKLQWLGSTVYYELHVVYDIITH